jgi:hypothetical protein
MTKWETVEETYTPGNCRYRVAEFVELEKWETGKFKPKWAWVSGADQLFYNTPMDNTITFA